MQENLFGHIEKLIVHNVGNKSSDEGVGFSNTLSNFKNVEKHINSLLTKNFHLNEFYKFYFAPDISLNPVFQFASSIFRNENFIEQSQNIARYLYDKSTHPKIKGGELSIFLLNSCVFNGEEMNILGMFKSEQKDSFIKFNMSSDSFNLNSEEGMNVKKLDKGCLIFDTNQEDGFLVAVTDNTNSIEAQYWKDEFLHVNSTNNEYNQTNSFLDITKDFVKESLTDNLSKSEQIDILNRSIDYFKENDSFNKTEFEKNVFENDEIIDSFRKFNEDYRVKNEIEVNDNFQISPNAVKKQIRSFKRILKLDENFDILIKGNKDLIEKGVDSDGRKFYKIYYNVEK
jgi:hypothetical protein